MRGTKLVSSLILATCTSVSAAPPDSNPGQPFAEIRDRIEDTGAKVDANNAAIGQAIGGIEANRDLIGEIPDLTVKVMGEGSTRWVSPHWEEAVASNVSGTSTVSVLNLSGAPVAACVTFYSVDDLVLAAHLLKVPDRNVGRVEFVGAAGASSRGWAEVAASRPVLVDGAIIAFARRGGETVGVRERTMTWYATGGDPGDPLADCADPDQN